MNRELRNGTSAGSIRRPATSLAVLLLGTAWVFLAAANASAADPAAGVAGLIGNRVAAQVVTWVLILFEFGIGGALLIGSGRAARSAAAASGALALLLAIYVMALDPAPCTCAGLLVPLDMRTHTIVVAVILLLSGMVWRFGAQERPFAVRSVGGLLIVLTAVFPQFMRDDGEPDLPEIVPGATSTTAGSKAGGDVKKPLLEAAGRGSRPESPLESRPGSGVLEIHGFVWAEEAERRIASAVILLELQDHTRATLSRERADVDSEGVFHFSVAERLVRESASSFVLTAWAEGYQPLAVEHAIGVAQSGPIEVRLRSGLGIRGRVFDQFGRGVAGARVDARGAGGADFAAREMAALGAKFLPRYGCTTSDEEGRFELLGLADGEYKLNARPPGYLRPPVGGDVRVRAGEGDARLRLRLVQTIRVQAVDAVTRKPIEHAWIEFSILEWNHNDLPHPHPGDVPSDVAQALYPGQGAASLALAPARLDELVRVSVDASATGYLPATSNFELSWDLAGATVPLPMQRATGRQVRAVPVHAAWADGVPYNGQLQFRTWPKGLRARGQTVVLRFVEGASAAGLPLALGPSVWIEMQGEPIPSLYRGTVRQRTELNVSSSEPVRISVALRGARLMIRPQATEGAPALEDFHLHVGSADGASPQGLFLSEGGAFSLWPEVNRIMTVNTTHLPPGRLSLVVRAYGFKPVRKLFAVEDATGALEWRPILQSDDVK